MKLHFKVVEATKVNEALTRVAFEGGVVGGSEAIRFVVHSREAIAPGTEFDAEVAHIEPPAPPKAKPAPVAEPASAKESPKKKK